MALTDDENYLRTDELLALQKPVYRIIGTGTPSLKGQHGELLLHGMKQRLVPELWGTRDDVIGVWTAAQSAKGHDPGYHG